MPNLPKIMWLKEPPFFSKLHECRKIYKTSLLLGRMSNSIKFFIDREVYSRIILYLSLKENYAGFIADKLDKDPSVIQKELDRLYKKRFVAYKQNQNNLNNKKVFYVNWEKLNSEFVYYLIRAFGVQLTENLMKNMRKNKYLEMLIKKAIKDHCDTYKNPNNWRTIKEIFNKLIMQMCYDIPPRDMVELRELGESNIEIMQFIDLSQIIYDSIHIDEKLTLEDFYEEIIPNSKIIPKSMRM